MLADRRVSVMIEKREVKVVINGCEDEHVVTGVDVQVGEIIIYLARIKPKAEPSLN